MMAVFLLLLLLLSTLGLFTFPSIDSTTDGGDRSAAALAASDLPIDENTSAAGRVDGC